ncbi:diphthamide biosynthesis protein 3 [Bemisia tabaci]|nr:PREDICTED: DPH3 homolog [Bemisia tabaci]
MSIYHDEVEIEDFEYDEENDTYYYPCPCGDRFEISGTELKAGKDAAECPSCSLVVKVIYDIEKFRTEDKIKSEEESHPKSTSSAVVN